MSKHPWLWDRKGTYWLRAKVPKDIRERFGREHVTFSLGTKDRRDADRLITIEAARVQERFDACREGAPPPEPLDARTLKKLCDRHYQSVIDSDFASRADITGKALADVDAFNEGAFIAHPNTDWYLTFAEELDPEARLLVCFNNRAQTRLEALERALAIGDTSLATEIVVSGLDGAAKLKLARKLMETEVAALKDILAKDRTRYEAIVVSGEQAEEPVASTSNPGPLLESLLDGFQREAQMEGLAAKSIISDATDLREFIEVVGNKPVRNYTKADGVKFKDALMSTPSQRLSKPFKGLPLVKQAKMATRLDPNRKTIPRLHIDTINDKLMAVRKFFKFANSHEGDVPNPIEGLRIKPKRTRGKSVERRYPFRPDELEKICNGTIYRGCKSPHHWKQPGALIPRDSASFWAPLIALYSGMRLGEIIQLRTADVKTDATGITYFDVTSVIEDDDTDADKSTKTVTSIRDIPVHSELLRFGLMALVAQRRKDGTTRLFTDYVQSPTDGSWSKTFSAWFRHYRRYVGVERIIKDKNRVDFHSFRHLFEDVARNLPDVKMEFRDALQGHGESGVSAQYGEGVARKHLRDAIEKMRFEVDLLHLYVSDEDN